jgi:transcriptional regulator with XRE-family HTH domain
MNVQQCRMARAGLGWSLDDLAKQSKIGRRTVAKFENGGNVLSDTVETLRQCFVKAGVEFINGGKSLGVKVPRQD